MRTYLLTLLFSTTILLGTQVQAQQSNPTPVSNGVSPALVADAGGSGVSGPAILAHAATSSEGMTHRGMMDRDDMGPEHMGSGDMPRGMMDRGHMMDPGRSGGFSGQHMRMIMALVDTDGDGALSLEEIQTAEARVFRYADADKDGKLTLAEIRSFMHGDRGGAPDNGDQ